MKNKLNETQHAEKQQNVPIVSDKFNQANEQINKLEKIPIKMKAIARYITFLLSAYWCI